MIFRVASSRRGGDILFNYRHSRQNDNGGTSREEKRPPLEPVGIVGNELGSYRMLGIHRVRQTQAAALLAGRFHGSLRSGRRAGVSVSLAGSLGAGETLPGAWAAGMTFAGAWAAGDTLLGA